MRPLQMPSSVALRAREIRVVFRVWLAMLPVAIRIHLSGKGREKGETALLMFDRSNNNC